jgi:hypothetical protein
MQIMSLSEWFIFATQSLIWQFLITLEVLWWLEETATHGNQLERKIWLMHVSPTF